MTLQSVEVSRELEENELRNNTSNSPLLTSINEGGSKPFREKLRHGKCDPLLDSCRVEGCLALHMGHPSTMGRKSFHHYKDKNKEGHLRRNTKCFKGRP